MWLAGSRTQNQQLWCMGLATLWCMGSSQTGARTHVPCIDRRTPNHCTTREAPEWVTFLYQFFFFSLSHWSSSLMFCISTLSFQKLIKRCIFYVFLLSCYPQLMLRISEMQLPMERTLAGCLYISFCSLTYSFPRTCNSSRLSVMYFRFFNES